MLPDPPANILQVWVNILVSNCSKTNCTLHGLAAPPRGQSQVRINNIRTCQPVLLSCTSEETESYCFHCQQFALRSWCVIDKIMISQHNGAISFEVHRFVCDLAEQSWALKARVMNAVLGLRVT